MTALLKTARRRHAIVALLLLLALPPFAAADFGEYREHGFDGQTLSVSTSAGELRITAQNASSFVVHYVEGGVKQLPSFAVAGPPELATTVVSDSSESIQFTLPGVSALVHKSPVRISFYREGELIAAEEHGYFAHETLRGFRFRLQPDEKILGGGHRVLGMDRRGRRMPLYNKADYGYTTESSQMYYGLPAIMSSERYVIAFDNTANGWLDIAHTEDGVLQFEAVGGRTAYILSVGDSYPELIEAFTGVVGRQPLPPRWAFGNFASRFGYRTEEETRDVVRRFQRAKIPLDAVILDLYWFGPDIQGHMGNLDWDREAFPNPESMIRDFAADGVNTIAITEPFILRDSKRWTSAVENGVLARNATGAPKTFDFYFGNTGLVDIFNEEANDWFWQPYEMLFEQGAAATWGDLGEPEVHPGDALHWLSDAGIEATADEVHNAYGHRWAQMVYERQVENFPDMRPLIMMRAGFLGTQRFGIVPWTGDVSRSWGGLKPQVELSLQMGLFGLGYTHSDLGGFAGGEAFDTEMYTRWLQYGVFQPVYRPHAQEHIAPEPVFHDRKTRNLAKKAIELRYRMLPYNYSLAYENSLTGMPLMRPLFFEDESNTDLVDEKDAYFWGDAFLVAPVTDAGVEKVDVSLPRGAWFDFWSDRRYDGAQTVSVPVSDETIPVLVRAGSFVPMANLVQTTRDYASDALELHYYADATVPRASGRLYEDDGVSRDSIASRQFERMGFDAQQSGDSLSIALSTDGGSYEGKPESRDITLLVHSWTAEPRSIDVNGTTLPVSRRLPKAGAGATYDRKSNLLSIRFNWHRPKVMIKINEAQRTGKPVIYQVFTRLFGNQQTTNKPWGTIEENGVGKFADFTDTALAEIGKLGVSHIWYTGVPHHAVIRDYTGYGISNDDPDIVKGRAGSPYAVKDYYSVNPDLAVDPGKRLEEFEALIDRTHDAGMKVIIDIVPNHVARAYESTARPDGVENFGANDDTSVVYRRDNNFYYVVGEDFAVPDSPEGYAPLGGDEHPLADGKFPESPAKWTGNGARAAKPGFGDWFETVKMNYGVRPDGSFDFDRLPDTARDWTTAEHAAFWRGKDVPDSWTKFRDIVSYWTGKGVDGFRYDMAEMVPVEFWSYLNSGIKTMNADALLLAEVYNPDLYRDYLKLGRMDYLYDKVGFYDTLKGIMQEHTGASALAASQAEVLDIEEHMLHFLENHDEQRVASADFAGDARKGMPAMVVSTLISRSPTMLYFAQEFGEPGDGNAGFGAETRTTIFDYWGVPSQQRWMNGGRFDGGRLSDAERKLRDFYQRLLAFSAKSSALTGDYREIHTANLGADAAYSEKQFAFVRWNDDERLIVVSNFDPDASYDIRLRLPESVVDAWQLDDGEYEMHEQLYGEDMQALAVRDGRGKVRVKLEPLASLVLRVGKRR